MSVLLCSCIMLTVSFHAILASMTSDELDDFWFNYKKTFDKSYNNDAGEELYRRSIWEENVNYVTKHNIRFDLGQETFSVGINEYSDWTFQEQRTYLLGFKLPPDYVINNTNVFKIEKIFQIPDSVDWRNKGYVTPVKNQGGCGSCWAFSSTGSMEGQHFRKTGRLVSLSEQNLVDCASKRGCSGEWMNTAFTYVKNNKGIDTESSYPYLAKNNPCRYNATNKGATCTGYVNVARSEADLIAAVATIGPISVAIDTPASFFKYRSGVYDEPSCKQSHADHAVLVVGYGTSQGLPYWLVKNSWGKSWGMQGYIMMSRNENNQCGIANYASYPTM